MFLFLSSTMHASSTCVPIISIENVVRCSSITATDLFRWHGKLRINFAKWPLIKWRWRLLEKKKKRKRAISSANGLFSDPNIASRVSSPIHDSIDRFVGKQRGDLSVRAVSRLCFMDVFMQTEALVPRALVSVFLCAVRAHQRMFAPHT